MTGQGVEREKGLAELLPHKVPLRLVVSVLRSVASRSYGSRPTAYVLCPVLSPNVNSTITCWIWDMCVDAHGARFFREYAIAVVMSRFRHSSINSCIRRTNSMSFCHQLDPAMVTHLGLLQRAPVLPAPRQRLCDRMLLQQRRLNLDQFGKELDIDDVLRVRPARRVSRQPTSMPLAAAIARAVLIRPVRSR